MLLPTAYNDLRLMKLNFFRDIAKKFVISKEKRIQVGFM